MDKVLIAEDDRILQSFLQRRLQKHQDKFEVIVVNNGEEAIEILKQKYISLLVTDIQMPKVDGMALLSYINNKHPHIPCIVMTAFPNKELEERLSDDNIFEFFNKPFKFEEFQKAILQALEQDVPDGTLKGISVSSFLQMIELEEKTCLLEVQSPRKEKGLFYLQKGIPYDATYGDLKGEEAAYEIIAMENAEITFKNLPRKGVAKRINVEITSLIMEAFRRKDEANE
ncbi:response regulator [Thermodesulfobacteriota bacterium]